MEIFRLFGSIFVKDEATKEIDKIEKKSDDASNKMSSSFGKVGKAIITAFSITAVLLFGKSMIETTAKVQALDSQFTQTFKNNGSQAMDLINQQAKEQGINVDRLKGTWASFYGSFRGNGADANQSLELTNKYMKLAGDGSSYYDLKLEDVSSRLKSIVMGNFEAGDAIGVNINATKMDIKAKEKYNKSWQNLTDTEKEFLLIDTVGTIYKNSGAMGQGAREANNLSNVTANLKATWERLLSTYGSPVLSVVVTVLQNLTNGIVNFATLVQQHQGTFTALAILISTLATAIGIYNLILNWTTISTAIATTATSAFGAVLAFITSPIAIVVLAIGGLIAIFVLLWNNCEGFRVFFTKMWESIKTITSQILEGYIIPFIKNELVPIFQKAFATIGDVVKGAFAVMKWAWDSILSPLFNGVILPFIQNVLLPIWKIIFSGIGGAVSSAFNTIKDLWNNSLKPILNGILDFISGVFTANWSKAWNGIKSIFGGVFEGMKTLFKAPINIIIGGLNGFIRGINKIKLPDWLPAGLAGKGINIPQIPMLASGGSLVDGDAIVGEAGAELLRVRNGRTTVTPLTNQEKQQGQGFNNQKKIIEIPFNIDGRELARLIVDPISEELAWKNNKSNFAFA
jgi:phage-related minor tail protein